MELLKCRILDNIESDENSGELSLREKEVLRELSSGKTNKEIARDLSISVNTVITHRKNISSKLGIKSVSGLSLYALMNGLI
ncbi:MAG: LuxR C-terminal-related transcriptional regulator [Muribaculaceae bacterium]|nr:LuxR C-terminal-related transcriptional regulator [Muribaculaceae bacterium]